MDFTREPLVASCTSCCHRFAEIRPVFLTVLRIKTLTELIYPKRRLPREKTNLRAPTRRQICQCSRHDLDWKSFYLTAGYMFRRYLRSGFISEARISISFHTRRSMVPLKKDRNHERGREDHVVNATGAESRKGISLQSNG